MTRSVRRTPCNRPMGLALCALLIIVCAVSSAHAQGESAAAADEVLLSDGTRILGQVTGMERGELNVETTSAGTVSIKFSDVRAIVSSGTKTFVLKDGSRQVGRPRVDDSGEMELETELSGILALDLATVEAINPPEKKAITHKGSVALNGRITDGNTRTKSAGAIGEYVARSDRQRLTLRADWNYSQDRGTLTARNASSGIKYDFFATEKLFAYANASFQGDDFADLNLRTTLGAGGGYQFVDRETLSFYEEGGISFFDEDFDSAPDDRFASARLSGKVDWQIRPGKLAFFHVHELFIGFEDTDDLFADTQTGLRLTLIGNFYANLQVNHTWDNTPAPGSRRGDTEYLLGLGYSFSL